MTNADLKKQIIDKYVELTGDTKFTASRIASYRSCRGWYFSIACGPLGVQKRKDLTYHAVALKNGWRHCTCGEELEARTNKDHNFTREDPATIGHVSFTPTRELLKIVDEVEGDFYIVWTPDHFWVEFRA